MHCSQRTQYISIGIFVSLLLLTVLVFHNISNIPSNNKSYYQTTALLDLIITQFNIRNANLENDDNPNCWSKRLPSIIEFFSSYNHSVVAVQELVVKSLQDLQTNLPSKYNILYASRQPLNEYGDENNKWNEMMAIIWDNSKLDLITFGKFSLCDTPQIFPCKFEGYINLKWYRIALWGLFSIKSTDLKMLFIATHLHGHTYFDDGFEIHNKQFQVIQNQIHKILEYYINQSLPLIFISADWNTYQYKEWWQSIINNTNNQWIDPIHVWFNQNDKYQKLNVKHTYHEFKGNKYDGIRKNDIMDWFISTESTINKIKVNNVHAVTSFFKDSKGHNVYLSDHYPVIMQITLY